MIARLRDIQEKFSYLPEREMVRVAKELGVPTSAVFGAATFYSHFTFEPKGKYVIRVCDGTACHVKKSEDIIKTINEMLGLKSDKKTSDDHLFTLEIVACLGACGIAPVVVLGDKVHGNMDAAKVRQLITDIRNAEVAK